MIYHWIDTLLILKEVSPPIALPFRSVEVSVALTEFREYMDDRTPIASYDPHPLPQLQAKKDL